MENILEVLDLDSLLHHFGLLIDFRISVLSLPGHVCFAYKYINIIIMNKINLISHRNNLR